MGEAIITRAGGGGSTEVQPPQIVANVCMILGILKDPKGKPMSNWPINCKDGTRNYNYKTDEKGQVIFSCNSGAANISFPNSNGDGIIYADILANTYNIDAPLTTSKVVNFSFKQPTTGTKFRWNSAGQYKYMFLNTSKINLFIGGGGGGGGGGYAGAGSGGECKYIKNIVINNYEIISATVGGGGGGGYMVYNNNTNSFQSNEFNGHTGETSYFGQYSAIGGNGGRQGDIGGVSPNNGWFGNGSTNPNKFYNSNVNYGGGGGKGKYLGSFNDFDWTNRIHVSDYRYNLHQNSLNRGSPGGGYGAIYFTYVVGKNWNSKDGSYDDKAEYGQDDSGTAGTDGLGGGGGAPLNEYGVKYTTGTGWQLCCGGPGGSGTIEIGF